MCSLNEPKEDPQQPQNFGFQLSLTMGYMNIAVYLCTTTKTATDKDKGAITNCHK